MLDAGAPQSSRRGVLSAKVPKDHRVEFEPPSLIISGYPSSNENENDRDTGERSANLGEQFAVARVESELAILRNIHLTGENAFRKGVAGVVAKDLGDAAEFVHKAGHARIGRANHRPPIFYTTEDRVCEMLMRSGGMQKPAVIRHINQNVRAVTDESPDQLADGIFKAN